MFSLLKFEDLTYKYALGRGLKMYITYVQCIYFSIKVYSNATLSLTQLQVAVKKLSR